MSHHAARPRLVVDNSSCIVRFRNQKIGGQGDGFFLGKCRNMCAPAPRDAIFPLIYPLPVEGFACPSLQFNSDSGASAQGVDEVSVNLHRPDIFGKIFRVVKAIIIPTTFGRGRGENRRMAQNGSPEYKAECGRRLIIAREVLGYAKRAPFVRALFGDDDPEQFKRDEDNVRTWENGAALVPAEFVDKHLKKPFGISQDYIFSGDFSTMRPDLALKIQHLEAEKAAG